MLLEGWKAIQGTLHNDEHLTQRSVYAAAPKDRIQGEQTPVQFLPLTMLLYIVQCGHTVHTAICRPCW